MRRYQRPPDKTDTYEAEDSDGHESDTDNDVDEVASAAEDDLDGEAEESDEFVLCRGAAGGQPQTCHPPQGEAELPEAVGRAYPAAGE